MNFWSKIKVKKTGIGAVFLLLVAFLAFYIWQGIYLPRDLGIGEKKFFEIKPGQGFLEISADLERAGLIKNKIFFELYVIWKKAISNLQAGKYQIYSSWDVPTIAEYIINGRVVKGEIPITIIEGWSIEDIASYLESKGLLGSPQELFEVTGLPRRKLILPRAFDEARLRHAEAGLRRDEASYQSMRFSQQFDFLRDKPRNLGLEGYLFPDTYRVKRGATAQELVTKFLNNFGKKLNPALRQEIYRQHKTVFEIVTMASLLEKEVKSVEDKRKVADILWKRLKMEMPLQVDATITYITGKKTVNISKKEIGIDSPYNTYKNRGLPLGPICNPGLDSLKAAIYPEPTEFLYYLSKPNGETVFSKTLEDHNRARWAR